MILSELNMPFCRGEDYGTPFVNDDSKTYLAFYENTETENPDFHHLESFKEVPAAVTADGYAFPDAFSNLWTAALQEETHPYHFLYEVVYPADCESFTTSEEYSCAVSTTRNENTSCFRILTLFEMSRTVRLQAREDNLRKMSILFQLDLLA